ncbi:DUF262 domain-containing protein [Enterococcus faecalis]|uniref:DUF262 domain-containing protein n=3 Tax=Enterococcus faecalis TaxID=1351 RepID=UPI00032EB06A|nr:DUF262 domain-containing protein [Enterococcus faecalis]EOI47981.1 hypothetical protein UK1_01028 [Enterococcus faecalis EnGen0301]EOJ79384.1 hypothetical protein WOA_01352 [Enterococcus faecalis EnGen0356]MCA6710084.1 DUF262 domain-containing protein [Enterococcus faecalis]MCA6723588.1 DUF262 domain-containing protein [Enterococcus faecalis]MCA6728624.1 DUF262 domain-containing protein [Enterococcus faecalis]
MGYVNFTIKNLIKKIDNNEYVLPALQREFVWKPEQIERLFDSIMKGYPIGSFLFWNVQNENINKYEFYNILKEYHQRDARHNTKINISHKDSVTAILDGQQRITSIYIALKGTYSYKIKGAWKNNDNAYPSRQLYLNIVSPNLDTNKDVQFDFRFLTNEEAEDFTEDTLWYPVSDILQFEVGEMFTVIARYQELYRKNFPNESVEKTSYIMNSLGTLHQMMEKDILAYYEENSQEIDKVLDIFIRMNSGGTTLTYSDLLLSLATAKWQNLNAREEIYSLVDELNMIGNGFNFNKDNILKAALVLTDKKNIKFRASNFDKQTTNLIETNWEKTKKAISLAVNLLSNFGFNGDTLIANSVIIPVVYYLYKIDCPNNYLEADRYLNDRNKIKYFVQISLLKRIFGGTPDSILLKMRENMQDLSEGFPLSKLLKVRDTNKSLIITDEDIDYLLDTKIGKYSFTLLSVIFPAIDLKNKFHQDHIFPSSKYKNKKNLREIGYSEEEITFIVEHIDTIVNLQLLEGIPNTEKNSKYFDDWILKRYNSNEELDYYLNRNLLNKVYKKNEFIQMYTDRKEELRKRLLQNLSF